MYNHICAESLVIVNFLFNIKATGKVGFPGGQKQAGGVKETAGILWKQIIFIRVSERKSRN